jgi:hypothetical protein
MKRIFAFNGTLFMSDEKFYSMDLSSLGYIISFPLILLSIPVDLNNYRSKFKVLASTISFQIGLPGRVLFSPCFIDEINPRGNVYCFELSYESINQCPIEEVPLKDFPLWIGSKYMSFEFETLLKG